MEVDLHTHSVYSDGQYTPRELLSKVKELGIKYYSLTDHDSIEGIKKLLEEDIDDIIVYSGVELSADFKDGQMHLLGYNFDVDNRRLNERLDYLKECTIENMKSYLEQIKEKFNIELPSEDIEELFKSNNIHKPSLALLLVKNGFCKDVPEVFTKYLNDNQVSRKIPDISCEECIELIKKAGGVVVLAHPWTLKLSNNDLKKEIEYLVSKGLDGIEIYHSGTSPKQTKYYQDLAREFNLITTGGTDFHGEKIKPDIKLGSGRNNNLNIGKNDVSILKKVTSRY